MPSATDQATVAGPCVLYEAVCDARRRVAAQAQEGSRWLRSRARVASRAPSFSAPARVPPTGCAAKGSTADTNRVSKNLGGEPLLLAFRFVCLTRGVHSRTLVITPPVTIVGVIAYFVASQPWLASTHHPNPVPRPHTCCGHHARRSSARVRRGRARRARAQQGHLRQGGEAIRQEWCAPPLSTHRAAAPCSLQRLVLAPNEPPTLQTSARDPHPVFAAFIKFLAPW